jgi:two-component system OmpR family sensor kinase
MLLLIGGFWYYEAQKEMTISMMHTKMWNLAGDINAKIIQAKMNKEPFVYDFDKIKCDVALFDKDKRIAYGKKIDFNIDFSKEMQHKNTYDIAITNVIGNYMNLKHIVIVDEGITKKLHALKRQVILFLLGAFIFIAIVGYFLSKLFLKPIEQKIEQIDDFIKDTTHELNTPITALTMSVERLLSQQTYNEKLIKNIKISANQLKELYSSLVYINFNTTVKYDDMDLDIAQTLIHCTTYFEELANAKKITLGTDIDESFTFYANDFKIKKLFNNILSNAIKYSHPNNPIKITLHNRTIMIQDYGIGIDTKQLNTIYQRYMRATTYSGGFGVGLNIVWMVAHEYGIKISVESELGEGTTFRVEFP